MAVVQCLNAVISYILSHFLVVYGCIERPVLAPPTWTVTCILICTVGKWDCPSKSGGIAIEKTGKGWHVGLLEPVPPLPLVDSSLLCQPNWLGPMISSVLKYLLSSFETQDAEIWLWGPALEKGSLQRAPVISVSSQNTEQSVWEDFFLIGKCFVGL